MENLKNGTKILIIKEFGNTNIIYEQGALRFEKKYKGCGFEKGEVTDMSWYISKENKFEILSEEDEEIDIQEDLRELLLEQLTEREHNNADIYFLGNHLNLLVRAIKQLDKKIKEK